MQVVLVHGFTQTGRSWDPVATRLRRAGHEVTAPDLPGHAGTPPAAGLLDAAAQVAAAAAPGPAAWVGYSLGGRVALHAVAAGAHVERLVLLGAHPGIDDPAERAERRAADAALAERIERIGVDAFLDEWLAQPLFAGLAGDAAGRHDRRRNTAEGLAASLRALGTGTQTPLWDALPDVPTLVVAGERDAKFVALGRRLAGAMGSRATFATVAGAGHAAHLEQPGAFADLVTGFLG